MIVNILTIKALLQSAIKKFKLTFLLTLFVCAATDCFATDFTIHHTEFYYLRTVENIKGGFYADVTLSWRNAWRNKKNHDAIWLFFKYAYSDRNARHVRIAPDGHQSLSTEPNEKSSLIIDPSKDRMGIFISPANQFRGDLKVRVRIALDTSFIAIANAGDGSFKAFGIEMVYIPEGRFYIGDTTALGISYNAFYKINQDKKPGGLYEIKTESGPLTIGVEEGNLYYNTRDKIYQGDQQGIVPADFPKGFNAFYVMKYELTQGQYADFLNSLSSLSSAQRYLGGGKDYNKYRGTLSYQNGVYKAAVPNRPCNYAGWDDGMAYADWSGLRPMTELEYTKACRGPLQPVLPDFPWNTTNHNYLQRKINENGDLAQLPGEIALTDENKEIFGASHYWVMDLSGSLWERVVTIGDSVGRRFKGTHGDGVLYYGYATNRDWPSGDNEKGGFGFRGGGFYENGLLHDWHVPYSPVEFRRFGAWSGGFREKAYGQRFVRTH